jgi:hypothetical protein
MSERASDSLLIVIGCLAVWFFAQSLVDYLDRCAPDAPVVMVRR